MMSEYLTQSSLQKGQIFQDAELLTDEDASLASRCEAARRLEGVLPSVAVFMKTRVVRSARSEKVDKYVMGTLGACAVVGSLTPPPFFSDHISFIVALGCAVGIVSTWKVFKDREEGVRKDLKKKILQEARELEEKISTSGPAHTM